jgi:ABC-2 type transport system permease protein
MTRMFRRVVRHELKLLAAERSLWVVSALLLLLCAYALANGMADARSREAVLAGIERQQGERPAALKAQWQRVMDGAERPDPFANPVDPAAIGSGGAGRHAVMPYAALAPVAFGQSDLLPNYYRMSYRSKASFLDDGELENPWNLMTGRFDLAFVIVVLLPLVILALSYNLVSSERESGTLRLVLAQSISLRTLITGKLAARALLVLGVMLVATVAPLLALRPALWSAQALDLLPFIGLLLLYAAFWFALAVAINALNRSSAFNALVLMAAWVALVLVLPVCLNLAVQAASPAPSRTEFATQTRLVTIQGLNRYNELLSADYRYVAEPEVLKPGADGRFEVAARRRAHYLLGRDVDAELDALRERFDLQLRRQQTLVDRWSALSPAVVTFEGLAAVAGTGSARYLHFRQQVDDYHQRWKTHFESRVLDGRAMTLADFDALPVFAWRELPREKTVGPAAWRIVALLLPTMLFALWTWRRLARVAVV